jgi:hypothetical protein
MGSSTMTKVLLIYLLLQFLPNSLEGAASNHSAW